MSTSGHTHDAASATLRGNFVLLRAESLRLLLPQRGVGVVEYIDTAPQTTAQTGFFAHGHGDAARPLVALSAGMKPLAAFPVDRFLRTQLSAGQDELSFAWNEVRVLIGSEFRQHPLPGAMRVRGAVIESYVELDGELALCTTAEHVMARVFEAGE